MPKPLSHKQRLAHLAEIDKEHAAEIRRDIQWLMDHPKGRRFMHYILYEVCELERGLYDLNDTLPERAVNELLIRNGARLVAKRLLRDLEEVTPEQLHQMRVDGAHMQRMDRLLTLAAEQHATNDPEEDDGF